jgi:hypothetical protein
MIVNQVIVEIHAVHKDWVAGTGGGLGFAKAKANIAESEYRNSGSREKQAGHGKWRIQLYGIHRFYSHFLPTQRFPPP